MAAITTDDLKGLIAAALERMAFVFTETPDLPIDNVVAEAVAHAAVDLHGRDGYTLTVSATAGIVTEIASGMIGCEADELDAALEGPATVAELANVFGGELVMQMSVDDDALHIGLPRDVHRTEALRTAAKAMLDGSPRGVVASESGRLAVVLARR